MPASAQAAANPAVHLVDAETDDLIAGFRLAGRRAGRWPGSSSSGGRRSGVADHHAGVLPAAGELDGVGGGPAGGELDGESHAAAVRGSAAPQGRPRRRRLRRL